MTQKVFASAGKLYSYPEGMFLREVTVGEEKQLERIGRTEHFISNNHGPIVARVVRLPALPSYNG